jgi:prepilin-type N-terminal cleavage/methylation domain-containing protein
MTRLAQKGFTLVELMIVVAIIGVLAVVAGTAYRRYMDSGRTAEAMAMLGEIRAKEEAYRAEFSAYTGWGGGGESEANTLPTVDSQTCFASGAKEPCAKAVAPSGWTGNWVFWQGLGITAPKSQLTCGYVVNYGSGVGGAGSGANAGYPSQTIGQNFLGTSQTNTPWWYAVAICDNDGTTTTNASFSTASTTTSVFTQNEHK